jgi:hypothetical protein
MLLYHGTHQHSALLLLDGADLDADVAAQNKIDGPPGFFLATELPDAEFFALRRSAGIVLRYEISENALQELERWDAVVRPVPRGRASPLFLGSELFVPTAAFRAFNELRMSGEIVVSLA